MNKTQAALLTITLRLISRIIHWFAGLIWGVSFLLPVLMDLCSLFFFDFTRKYFTYFRNIGFTTYLCKYDEDSWNR